MFWTLELASHLEDAPWPATKDELIDFGIRSGAPKKLLRTYRNLMTKVKFMKVLKISGLITQARKISFLMKMNIKIAFDFLLQKET